MYRSGYPHKVIDIRAMSEVMSGSALTSGDDIPEGHYEEENMKATVVPNRNMILLSLATGYAVTVDAGAVWYGAHGGDHAIYPDCRPEFVEKWMPCAGWPTMRQWVSRRRLCT